MRIASGVRFNVNKRSVGMSVGTRGARYSINSDGRRNRSLGIPGSGLYYRSQSGPTGTRRSTVPAGTNRFSSPARLLAHAVGVTTVLVFLLAALNGKGHFAGLIGAVGVIAYIALRLLRPILDPLISWLATRNSQKTPSG